MTEADIEQRMRKAIESRGGLCLKFVSPGNNGVPDRIVITPLGRIVFVELKTENGVLSGIQRLMIDSLHLRRVDVRVLSGWKAVERFINELDWSKPTNVMGDPEILDITDGLRKRREAMPE